jgi:hypothetical protein
MKRLAILGAFVASFLGFVDRTQADVISVFSTGVDGAGNLLPGGSVDTHYTVTGPGVPGGGQAIVLSSLFSTWLPDDPHSGWIGWIDNAFPGNYGVYTYETRFDLTGFNPATATLNGFWAADQFGNILLNGTTPSGTGLSVPDLNWDVGHDPNLTAFSITSGFVSGMNTLDFVVTMPDGFDGLRVRNMELTASPVPEPSTIIIAALGALGVASRMWCRGVH